MQQQQANSTMTADRNLLSDKEFHYLKDYMSWELLSMKKCRHAAQSCQDPEIQTQIRTIGKTHTQHFNTLLSYLQ